VKAVILAGGKGRRLHPYTTVFPKPLMPIGDRPILELVIRQLVHAGIKDVVLTTGYLAELLRSFFGDGKRFGVRIEYSREETPLGTVGPLSLIEGLSDTFILMNGDVLTDLDFRALIDFHREKKAAVTIASKVRKVKLDYGVLEADGEGILKSYREKPELECQVSMGIYVLERSSLSHLEPGVFTDFPDFVRLIAKEGERVAIYPADCYWLDIGRPEDYGRAVEDFERLREEVVPWQ